MTLLEVLQSSADYFKKRKIDNPRLNAEHLLAHVLGLRRLDLYLEFEREMDESELKPLRDFLRRRGEGEPLQHLLGTVEFCGHSFLCDNRALVPRPETEELVELIISKLENPKSRIVDVGTGGGVIALSLAAKFPAAEILAVDISDRALELARANAARLELRERVRFMKGHLLDGVEGEFDLVVANLPYVPAQDRPSLSREVQHDPEIALFAGENGEQVIRELITHAPSRLRSSGLLALEIGIGQSESLSKFLAEKNFHDIESKRDYAGIPRFLLARYG